jgi:hypothetical protein
MDFHLNRPEHQDPLLDFTASCCCSTSFTDRIRFIGELELEHALVEGLGIHELSSSRHAGLPGEPGVQPARGTAARASGDHQRAPRTPVLSRRRAAVRRHVHHSDDVVRAGAGIHGTFGAAWHYRAP